MKRIKLDRPGGNKNLDTLEEVKIDRSGNTIIDLNSHKNNIRVRKDALGRG